MRLAVVEWLRLTLRGELAVFSFQNEVSRPRTHATQAAVLTYTNNNVEMAMAAKVQFKERFLYVWDTKQLAKRRNKGEAQKEVKEYVVYKCTECGTEFTILKSNLSRMRKCAFRDHLASCLAGTEEVRTQNDRKNRGRCDLEDEVMGEDTRAAIKEIESYSFRRFQEL